MAKIEELVDYYNNQYNLLEKDQLMKLEASLDKVASNQTYFDALESMAIKLQRRVTELTKHMSFNPVTSSKDLRGDLCQTPPVDFLTQDEKDALYKKDKLRTSFYKILLFSHMAQEYLIDEQLWKEKPQELIEKAGLTDFIVNDRFIAGENIHLKIDKDDKIIFYTPKTDSSEKEYISSLLSQAGFVPILQVLSDINYITQFMPV